MKTPLSRLALVCMGLALSFAACDNRDVVAASATEESSATGKVAFRLSDTLLQVVKQTSDSVRIEAVRDGFATRTAAGSIGGITHLSNLEPGAWTLKIATYDALRAVGWYGETVVQIKAGSTVDAVVVLRRASGSVNVHIVLDTLPTVVDTARWTVKPSTGTLPGYLPILKSWRSDSGIFILTSLYCASVVVRQIPDSGTVFRFGTNPDIMAKCAVGTPGPVVVFVPWKNCGNVTLLDANGKGGVLSAPSCFPTEPIVDTVTVKWIEGNPGDSTIYKPLPVEGAWRTDKGIYIATRYDYFQPVVVHSPMQSSRPRRLYLVGTPINTLVAVKLLPHIVFVPFPADEDVIVSDLANKSVFQLPGEPVVVDPPPALDTVTVNFIEGNPADYQQLPVEGARRTDKGIYIATRYDYFQPVVVFSSFLSSRPRRLVLVGTPIKTFAAVKLLPHLVFVPFPADEDVIISDLANKSVFQLPGNRDVVPVKDSSFVRYTLTSIDGLARDNETIALTANGELVRTSFNSMFDSGPLVQTRLLGSDTLDMIRSILERSSTRHPGGLPTITAANCPSDAPIHSRVINYANGSTSYMKWSLTEYCGELPASWTALDPIDLILRRSFKALPVGIEPAE